MSVPSQSSVSADGVTLRFGHVVAVATSSFEIPSRGLTAIIGPNGSGKSTVLAAIAGLHRPSEGTISVLGKSPGAAREHIAFVPQATKVNDALPVTVKEVVAMGRYATLGLTRRFGARDFAAVENAMEALDLRDVSARHLRELSGGQRQRVFIAQGLVQDRRLLLLDEPSSALDLVSSQVIADTIDAERRSDRPVVVTTHDLGEAQRADHVILLAGRVVAQGKPDVVLTSANLSEAYRSEIGEVAGHIRVDDPAHDPSGTRHVHVEPTRYHPKG